MKSHGNNDMNSQSTINELDGKLLADKISIISDTFVNINELSEQEFFQRIFENAFLLIPEAQKGSFYKLEEDLFRPIFSKGYDSIFLNQLTFSKSEAFIDFNSSSTQTVDAYQVYISKRDDSLFSENQIYIFKQLGTYADFASLYAPIRFEGSNIGLLSIENFDKKAFSENSRLILKIFAQFISTFYTLKVQKERENKMYREVIDALISAIEVKDKYTEGHAKRVSQISVALGEKMEISKNRLKVIHTAGMLHDVGKIGTPTHILIKKEKLTKDENDSIMRHPEDARKILNKIHGFEEIANLTYMHHEHYDGSGYPQGLSGDAIPLEAHIIQVADAFDAMTSNRAYRAALSINIVMDIFREERGKQFHPEVTDVLLNLLKSDTLIV